MSMLLGERSPNRSCMCYRLAQHFPPGEHGRKYKPRIHTDARELRAKKGSPIVHQRAVFTQWRSSFVIFVLFIRVNPRASAALISWPWLPQPASLAEYSRPE